MGRKHCGKRRNCSLRAISPFPHSVFQRLILQTRENQGLFGKGLKHGISFSKSELRIFLFLQRVKDKLVKCRKHDMEAPRSINQTVCTYYLGIFTAFCPYHIGHFTMIGMKMGEVVCISPKCL